MAAPVDYQGDFINPAYMYTPSEHMSAASIPGEYRQFDENSMSTSKKESRTQSINISTIETIEKDGKVNEHKNPTPNEDPENPTDAKLQRENWGNGIEFLMSCIAMSVGLGNVWRFPFTALENGGGAFVIPYLIVLFLVGKPIYYMEMLLGQFSSKGNVKMYDFAPIMRGVGYGQTVATGIITTYYGTLMALILRYFVDSFHYVLPWNYCREEWGDTCINSKSNSDTIGQLVNNSSKTTSAEFYFNNIILREKQTIDDGIGFPSWSLSITLAISWSIVTLILIKGVKSSGKASYILAIFPYCIMLVLLARALTLPGAYDGVLYFLKPQWDKLLDAKVWYAAVTQVFFSLAICFGNIVIYSSYNRFEHNIKRDCNIITTLDTFTSLLSGIIIFGILGNLAYESNTTDIKNVVKGGPGLAFISYPDAIAKFKFVPQIFSVLFFLMLYVLGIGSNVGMTTCIITIFKDRFTKTRYWIIVVCTSVACYCSGLLYITPGGQYMLNLLDYYGVSFVALVLAIFELIAVGWIYGVKRFCKDIQFMLGIKTSIYYRFCWAVVTPALMIAILVYTLAEYKPLEYKGYIYQDGLYIFGWCVSAVGIGQLLIWGFYSVYKRPGNTWWECFTNSFKPKHDWGPLDPNVLKAYKLYMDNSETELLFKRNNFWYKIYDNIFG